MHELAVDNSIINVENASEKISVNKHYNYTIILYFQAIFTVDQ